jgi:hypothetical protein
MKMKRHWIAVAVSAGLVLAMAGAAPALAIPTDPGDGDPGPDPCSGISATLSLTPIFQGQLVRAQWSVNRPTGCFGNASMLSGPGAPSMVYGAGGTATIEPPSSGTLTYQVTAFTPGSSMVVAQGAVTVQVSSSPDGSFQFVNYGSLKCVEIVPNAGDYFQDGLGIQQRTCDGSPAQRWFMTLVRTDDRLTWHVVNRYTLKCLDVKDGSSQDGAVLQQVTCNPDRSSSGWVLGGTALAAASRNLASTLTWKVLDVANGSLNDFARVQQYHGTDNNTAQTFFLV